MCKHEWNQQNENQIPQQNSHHNKIKKLYVFSILFFRSFPIQRMLLKMIVWPPIFNSKMFIGFGVFFILRLFVALLMNFSLVLRAQITPLIHTTNVCFGACGTMRNSYVTSYVLFYPTRTSSPALRVFVYVFFFSFLRVSLDALMIRDLSGCACFRFVVGLFFRSTSIRNITCIVCMWRHEKNIKRLRFFFINLSIY